MKNPGYLELTIQVSELAQPWLLRHYPDALRLVPEDAITEKLYWMAQTEKLSLSLSDKRPHVRYTHSLPLEIGEFHGSRWNKFAAERKELQLFNYVETRLWLMYVETRIRQDLHEHMSRLGITPGFEAFATRYGYGDVLDYEREVRTYSNHRRSGELNKWIKNQQKK